MSALFKSRNKEAWQTYNLNELVSHFPEEAKLLKDSDLISHPDLIWFSENNRLGLGKKDDREFTPAYIDLDGELSYHQSFYQKNPRAKEPFYKAMKESFQIIDATGGWLKDTCLLLAWEKTVHVFEENPIVQVLILNAIKNAKHELVQNLNFTPKRFDWSDVTGNETVYYDPFYKLEGEKTKPQKSMQVLKMFAANSKGLSFPVNKDFKIVVKRKPKQEELWGKPSHSYEGKNSRYDLY